MSDTDSELEFESADEGAQNINVDDLDLSDLSSDEDASKKKENKTSLNESIKQSAEKELSDLQKVKKKETNTQNLNDKISIEKYPESEKKIESIVEDEKKIENKITDKELKDTLVDSISQKLETINYSNNSSDSSDSKSIKVEFQESSKKEEPNIVIEEPNTIVKSESIQKSSVSIKNNDLPNKKAEIEKSLNSGWDETEFSDLDDETEKDESTKEHKKSLELVVSSSNKQIENNKRDESNLAMIQKSTSKQNILKESIESSEQISSTQSNQPKQQVKSSGWGSWSKFGNVLSSATASVATLTSAVLETVEATIGAPDPSELAAIVKAKQTESELDSKAQQEISKNEDKKQQIGENNDWNNDDDGQEWFTFNPLNKLASTVIKLKLFDNKLNLLVEL
jgi:hypothetical protein